MFTNLHFLHVSLQLYFLHRNKSNVSRPNQSQN